MKNSWIRSFAMASVFALVTVPAGAQEALFSPFDSSRLGAALGLDPSFQALSNDPATASLEIVQANAGALTDKAASLSLSLQGLDLQAHRVDSHLTESGMLVWSGVLADPGSATSPKALSFDPINTVMLVKNGDKITGNVHFGGEWYKIRPLKSGGHAIVNVNFAAMPPDHPEEAKSLPNIKMPAFRQSRSSQDKADTVIRVLVSYTSSAASASGDINGLINLAIAETNQGYTNSGVLIDVVLASSGQVTYTQSGSFSTDLSRYRGTSDGFMDTIHSTRNSSTADVAVLLINNASSCGLASSIGSSASTAFAVAHWDCATGYYSFAHEIGHLQSARHDPATDGTNSPYAYGHGYQYNGNPKWRTIMAYACSGGCPRLNYWSNPAKLYNGQPMGTTTRSDNARVLNNTRNTVAAFR